MTSDPGQDWTRLGELLLRRRLDLNPRYRNRQVFAAERGVEYRIVSDFERHRRTNYHAVTIAEIERAYELPPGSVARVLAGGDPMPPPGDDPGPRDGAALSVLPGGAPTPDDAAPSQGAVGFAAAFGVSAANPADPYIQSVRRAIADAIMVYGAGASGSQIFRDYSGAEADAQMWDTPAIPRADKELFVAGMRAYRARQASGQGNGHARIGLASPVASGVT